TGPAGGPVACRLLVRLRLPHCQGGAGGVGDDAHRAEVADLHDVGHDLGPELARLPCRRADVGDADVGQPVWRRAGRLVHRHPAAGPLAHLDHRVGDAAGHRNVLQLPVEELAVELLRACDVAGVELDVHEWIGHEYLLPTQAN